MNFNILKPKPQYTVQMIHDEVDQAGELSLRQAQQILEDAAKKQDLSHAELARRLGFVASQEVKQASGLIPTQQLAEQLQTYMEYYEGDKIIPLKEFDRICAKYGLIKAPIAFYTGNVPYKNLQEIDRGKATLHPMEDEMYFKITEFDDSASIAVRATLRSKKHRVPRGYSHCTIDTDRWEAGRMVADYLKKEFNITHRNSDILRKVEITRISRNGLIIAATKDQFDLRKLKADKSGLGYSTEAISVVLNEKDPIVFEYLEGDFVRVRTKWGAEEKIQELQ